MNIWAKKTSCFKTLHTVINVLTSKHVWNISVGLILDVVACHFYMLWDLSPWKYTGTEGWALRYSVTTVAVAPLPHSPAPTLLIGLTCSHSPHHVPSVYIPQLLLCHLVSLSSVARQTLQIFVCNPACSWPAHMKTKFEFRPNNHKILFCFDKSFNLPSDNKMPRYWTRSNHSN